MENIDDIIITRLGEHQRKSDFIRQRLERVENTPRFTINKSTYVIISAVACLAILFAISPMLLKSGSLLDMTIAEPSFSEYRGGSSQIESLLNEKEYVRALSLVESDLTQLEKDMSSMDVTEMVEDESEYLLMQYNVEREELLWCRIYLLTKLDRKDDLQSACQDYFNDIDLQEHRKDVEKILEKFK